MSYEWLRGHYQNNEYGYVSLNYKFNDNLDVQLRPSMTTYDMMNNEKMPYSGGAYGRDLRQGDYREDRRVYLNPIRMPRSGITKMKSPAGWIFLLWVG